MDTNTSSSYVESEMMKKIAYMKGVKAGAEVDRQQCFVSLGYLEDIKAQLGGFEMKVAELMRFFKERSEALRRSTRV